MLHKLLHAHCVKCGCAVLQYEHHLLLQSLQCAEQGRLDLAVVVLMVSLSSPHRKDVFIMELVEFQCSLYVTLFGLVTLFVCTRTCMWERINSIR